MKDIRMEIQKGFQTAYIDYSSDSNLAYRPQFISNDYQAGKKVLSSIEQELQSCQEFSISVAFITMSGITPLLQTFAELEERGIKGKIMTTDYLTFSEPKALRILSELSNIELRMFCVEREDAGFHTKGYIFREDEIYKIIVGSSNMTLSALTKNKEWNTKIISTSEGEYTKEILEEFEGLWVKSKPISEWITTYTEIYEEQKRITRATKVPSIQQYRLEPNSMQISFIQNLKKIQQDGEKKALLISATGTGKTYASAFALRNQNPEKALFLVHREQIAKQAIKSYKNVFGDTKKIGLLSGNSKDFQADYLFSTMQMMARPEIRQQFQPEEFQTIVIDEAHRTGATSYQDIMNYFKPQFCLGMTASPERTDTFDVYKAFDHNIAYEIRLQQALEENLLCPFHYFGIKDLEINGETFDDVSTLKQFNLLTSDERVKYVIEKIKYFGYCGDRVKGLVFCSTKEEARIFSEKFNRNGYSTLALTGEDSQEKREEMVEKLVGNDMNYKLDYIFTVDIFNEGVDIPEVNQVVMLRPTQSPIVFVQQLGRGLRKADNKEYVVILDFIGNYTNNFMIPIALSGDRSYNKDSIRRYVMEGGRVIPGSSTIHFDEISRKRIYSSIDTANFNDIRLIRENYNNLKQKLGHIPKLKDFDSYGYMDVLRIFDNNSLGSYYKFLVKYEKNYKIRFNKEQEKCIEFISKKMASGKRVHELLVLQQLLRYPKSILKYLHNNLQEKYGIKMTDNTVTNVVNIMTNEFPSGTGKATYEDCVLIQPEGRDYCASDSFIKMIQDKNFYEMVLELVEFGLERNKIFYGNRYLDTNFQLYQKYTYEDVCRLLDWEKAEVALNIGGYKYDEKTKTYPVFINYEKGDKIVDTQNYEDRFISNTRLIALSKSGRNAKSKDVNIAYHAKELGVEMDLFVRKNKDDKISKEFYYLGKIQTIGTPKSIVMKNTNKKAVEIQYELLTPIREDIYEYIVS
ncbi:MAG: DEAD/DEAH box helicase [Lachnospiraceae bacterium]